MDLLLKDFDSIALRVQGGIIQLIDQRRLPSEEIWLTVNSVEDAWDYIKTLATRGAPMIGCVAGLALALYAITEPEGDVVEKAEYLKTSRPTAVNLFYACDLIANDPDHSAENVVKIAYEIIQHEIDMCDRMATFGAELIKDGDNILTHCNTGSLATMGLGTALGVIKKAFEQGKNIHVYVDETRPLLQGGRLTAYELKKAGIPYSIICDNMAGMLMKQNKIQHIFVGADRIALNGDFANKIGTYTVAVLAHYHKVPFYPVAPVSTIDFECETGDSIPIEMRKDEEVHGAFGTIWAPSGSPTYNPAFDVTPHELVTAYILDSGIMTKEQVDNGFILSLKSD